MAGEVDSQPQARSAHRQVWYNSRRMYEARAAGFARPAARRSRILAEKRNRRRFRLAIYQAAGASLPRDLPAANLLWALPTKVQILVIEYTSFPEKREDCLQKIHNFVKGMSQDIKEERKVTVIYITGNIHGEREVFDTDMYRRLKEGDTLLICGDFGFLWNGDREEAKILASLGLKPYTILFVDGSHENFDLLERFPEVEYAGGRAHQLVSNVYHLMRGEVFTIEGKTIFAFGGGESEDKQFYIEAERWWPQEMPTGEEMERGRQTLQAHGNQVDYIVTHDPAPQRRVMYGESIQRNPLEVYFEELGRTVKYDRWFYGSRHVDQVVSEHQISLFRNVIPMDLPVKKVPKGKEARVERRQLVKAKKNGLLRGWK